MVGRQRLGGSSDRSGSFSSYLTVCTHDFVAQGRLGGWVTGDSIDSPLQTLTVFSSTSAKLMGWDACASLLDLDEFHSDSSNSLTHHSRGALPEPARPRQARRGRPRALAPVMGSRG